jgi:hypothetical protein
MLRGNPELRASNGPLNHAHGQYVRLWWEPCAVGRASTNKDNRGHNLLVARRKPLQKLNGTVAILCDDHHVGPSRREAFQGRAGIVAQLDLELGGRSRCDQHRLQAHGTVE